MAHLITLEIGEGKTKDCSECPFNVDIESNEGYTGISLCGLPESFPDCDDVNYQRLKVRKVNKSN